MLITRLSMTLYWLFFYFWNSLLTGFHSTLLIALFLFCPSLPSPYCWVHFSYPYCLLVFLKCQFSPYALCSFHYYFSAKNFSHLYTEYRPLPELRVSTAFFHKDALPKFQTTHFYLSLFISTVSVIIFGDRKTLFWSSEFIYPFFWQSYLVFQLRKSSIPHSQSSVSHLPQPCEPTLTN